MLRFTQKAIAPESEIINLNSNNYNLVKFSQSIPFFLLLTNSVKDLELYKAPSIPNIGSQNGMSIRSIIADKGA